MAGSGLKLVFLSILAAIPLLGNAAAQAVSAVVSPYLELGLVSNIDMGVLPFGVVNVSSESFCVASNDTVDGDYKISFSGDGVGNAFTVSSATTADVIPYAVEFNDQDSNSGYVSMTSGQLSGTRTAGIIDSDCDVANARFRVSIQPGDIASVHSGNDYVGTLVINLSANT